jgi:protein-S-isoprenylcysteine O-methyltransferase Ste14
MKISVPLILFLASIAFRNFMQVALTRGKIRGRVFATLGTLFFYLTYLIALTLSLNHLFRYPGLDFFFTAGFVILWIGILMRVAGLKQLGRYYSSFIELRESQSLVTNGLFSIIRHPLHFSILMEVVGMGIISTNVFSLFPMAILLVTILLRNRNEDQKLLKHFGWEYENYRKKVPSMNILWGFIRKVKKDR